MASKEAITVDPIANIASILGFVEGTSTKLPIVMIERQNRDP
jgi:hypothetical protein